MKKMIVVVIILPLLCWCIWGYFSAPLSVAEEEEITEEIGPSSVVVPKKQTSHTITRNKAPKTMQQHEEKLGRLEEKYMTRMESLVRLLEKNNLQNLSIGDDMPNNLPTDVEDAWRAYLNTLTQLEKLRVQYQEIEEDFIHMAHQGISLAMSNR